MAAIHDITEDDWRLLRTVRLRALRDAPHAFTADYGDEVGHDERWWRDRLRGNLWLLAFQDAAAAPPIGVIAATREPVAPAGDPFLSSLWVDPRHRRQGIALELIEAAADLVAAGGAAAVSLWVLDRNEAAHRLYEAAGFVPTGDRQIAPGSSKTPEQRLRRNLRLARPADRARVQASAARTARSAGRIHLITWWIPWKRATTPNVISATATIAAILRTGRQNRTAIMAQKMINTDMSVPQRSSRGERPWSGRARIRGADPR